MNASHNDCQTALLVMPGLVSGAPSDDETGTKDVAGLARPGHNELRRVIRIVLRTGASCLLVAVLIAPTLAAEIPLSERKSGYEFMGRETRAMQDDDTTNPGMLWVLDGEALWKRQAGEANKSCADCHGEAPASMKGVAARYPAFDAARRRPINLDERIDICRSEQQKATRFAAESKDLLALSAYVSRQSRGMPIDIKVDDRTRPFIEAGRMTYELRQGQLNLSCANCHDDNWGQKLAGAPIPQAHPTGYPQYRLEWQTLGSLQRRLRNCLVGMRAESFPLGSPDYVDLEIFLKWRALGMPVEAPAVRP
jgi:sulfur-oxidizing protein SoxA